VFRPLCQENGLPTDIVQKIYHYRPRGRAGARGAPDRPETLTIAAVLVCELTALEPRNHSLTLQLAAGNLQFPADYV
jgi:hypothetical protein